MASILNRTWEKALCALFLFFLSSCTPSCPKWRYNEAIASCPSQNVARVIYPSKNICNGLELEITNSSCGLEMYINISSLYLPQKANNPKITTVRICIDGDDKEIDAYRLGGGQRLRIPEETRYEIINTLLACKPVTLQIGRFKETISPEEFSHPFMRLLRMRRV